MPSSGVCPGRIPRYPSAPGSSTSSTVSRTSILSGVTTSISSSFGRAIVVPLLHLRGVGPHILDAAGHVERLLRHVVVLAFGDFLEAADGVGDGHVLALAARELLGHEERLRQELLDLARARHR